LNLQRLKQSATQKFKKIFARPLTLHSRCQGLTAGPELRPIDLFKRSLSRISRDGAQLRRY
jgi:hypothetical protein